VCAARSATLLSSSTQPTPPSVRQPSPSTKNSMARTNKAGKPRQVPSTSTSSTVAKARAGPGAVKPAQPQNGDGEVLVTVPAASAAASKAACAAEQAAQPVVQAPPAQSTTTEWAEAGDNSGYATADSDELLSASSTPSTDVAAAAKVTPDTAPPTWPDLADMTADPEAPAPPAAAAAAAEPVVSAPEPAAAVSPPLPASTVPAASPGKPVGTAAGAAPAASWAEQCVTWLLCAYTYPVSLPAARDALKGCWSFKLFIDAASDKAKPCAQEAPLSPSTAHSCLTTSPAVLLVCCTLSTLHAGVPDSRRHRGCGQVCAGPAASCRQATAPPLSTGLLPQTLHQTVPSTLTCAAVRVFVAKQQQQQQPPGSAPCMLLAEPASDQALAGPLCVSKGGRQGCGGLMLCSRLAAFAVGSLCTRAGVVLYTGAGKHSSLCVLYRLVALGDWGVRK
jgi:hypothetical protein